MDYTILVSSLSNNTPWGSSSFIMYSDIIENPSIMPTYELTSKRRLYRDNLVKTLLNLLTVIVANQFTKFLNQIQQIRLSNVADIGTYCTRASKAAYLCNCLSLLQNEFAHKMGQQLFKVHCTFHFFPHISHLRHTSFTSRRNYNSVKVYKQWNSACSPSLSGF